MIPAGFAHASVLSATAVMYKCDALYNKESEAGIIITIDLAIDWQLPESAAIVSDKDLLLPSFESKII